MAVFMRSCSALSLNPSLLNRYETPKMMQVSKIPTTYHVAKTRLLVLLVKRNVMPR